LKKLSIFKMLPALLTGIVFAGCAPTYDIEPNHDKQLNTLEVGLLKFDGVVHDNKESSVSEKYLSHFLTKEADYQMNNDKCENIRFYKTMSTTDRAYITANTDMSLKKYFFTKKKGNCEITEVSNLKFYTCSTASYSTNKYYYIASDSRSSLGFKSVTELKVDKTCFNSLKDSFVQDATANEVDINSYSFN